MYALGVSDGLEDAARKARKENMRGPQPPFPQYRVMYDKGYAEGLTGEPDYAEDGA